jgi:hypothetical protein
MSRPNQETPSRLTVVIRCAECELTRLVLLNERAWSLSLCGLVRAHAYSPLSMSQLTTGMGFRVTA